MSWVALHYRFIIAISNCYLQEQDSNLQEHIDSNLPDWAKVWHCKAPPLCLTPGDEGGLGNLDVEEEELVNMITFLVSTASNN